MGLRRDNRARQRLGKLLDLTKPQQIDRQLWQANRKPDWTDKLIHAPITHDGIMSWGFARTFDVELKKFTHVDMPGSCPISRVIGKSSVVRTDTTDRISRAKSSRAGHKLKLYGD